MHAFIPSISRRVPPPFSRLSSKFLSLPVLLIPHRSPLLSPVNSFLSIKTVPGFRQVRKKKSIVSI